jgi:hypothetical protein
MASVSFGILQEQGQILTQGRLIVLGEQQLIALGAGHLLAPLLLGMHGIGARDASFELFGRHHYCSGTEFILLGGHGALG